MKDEGVEGGSNVGERTGWDERRGDGRGVNAWGQKDALKRPVKGKHECSTLNLVVWGQLKGKKKLENSRRSKGVKVPSDCIFGLW